MSENTADCCRASPSAAAAASAATVSSSGGDGKAPKLPDRVKRNGILISLRVASARRMSCGGCGPALRCVPAELQRAMDWDVQSMAAGRALTPPRCRFLRRCRSPLNRFPHPHRRMTSYGRSRRLLPLPPPWRRLHPRQTDRVSAGRPRSQSSSPLSYPAGGDWWMMESDAAAVCLAVVATRVPEDVGFD